MKKRKKGFNAANIMYWFSDRLLARVDSILCLAESNREKRGGGGEKERESLLIKLKRLPSPSAHLSIS